MKVIKYILIALGIFLVSVAGGFLGGYLSRINVKREVKGAPLPGRPAPFYIRRIKELMLSPEINRESVFIYLRELENMRYKRDSMVLNRIIEDVESLPPKERLKYLKRIAPRYIPRGKRRRKTRR